MKDVISTSATFKEVCLLLFNFLKTITEENMIIKIINKSPTVIPLSLKFMIQKKISIKLSYLLNFVFIN